MRTKTNVTQSGPTLLEEGRPHFLGLFRIAVGLMFVSHGASSLFGVLGVPAIHAGQWPFWWAGLVQLVAGTLVMVGLGTRIAAVLCSGSMAYAYFTVHQSAGLFPMQNGGEKAALFCWSFLLIAAMGPGRWALDSRARRQDAPESRVLADDARGVA